MKQYKIFAGLGGGFGGAQECDILEFASKEAAEEYAYEVACETYDMYAGMHGLRSVDDIMEEEGFGEVEAEEAYREERENWLDYYVEEIK